MLVRLLCITVFKHAEIAYYFNNSDACLIVYRHYLPLPLKVVKIEVAAMAACHTMPKCNHQLAMCRHLHGIRKQCHWSCTSNVHDPVLSSGFTTSLLNVVNCIQFSVNSSFCFIILFFILIWILFQKQPPHTKKKRLMQAFCF